MTRFINRRFQVRPLKNIKLFFQLLTNSLTNSQQILTNVSLTIKVAINLDDGYAEATFPQLVLKRQLQFKQNIFVRSSSKQKFTFAHFAIWLD